MTKTYSTSEQSNAAAEGCSFSAMAGETKVIDEQGSASVDDFWSQLDLDDIADIESLNESLGDKLQDNALDGTVTADALSVFTTSLETYGVEAGRELDNLTNYQLYELGLSVVQRRRDAATTNGQMSIAPVVEAEDEFSRWWRNRRPLGNSIWGRPPIKPERGDGVLCTYMARNTVKGPDFTEQICEPLVESTPARGQTEGESTEVANEERWTQQFLHSLIQREENPATYQDWVERVTSQHLREDFEYWSRFETPLLELKLRDLRPLNVGEEHISKESHERAQLFNPALLVVLDRAISKSDIFEYDSMWLFPKEVKGLVNSLTHQWAAKADMITPLNARKVLRKAFSETVSFRPATYTHETGCGQLHSEVIDMPERPISIPSGLTLDIRPHTNWTPECNQHFKMPKAWEFLYSKLKPEYNEWLAKDVKDEEPVSDTLEPESIHESTPASDTSRVTARRRTPPHEDDDAEHSARVKRVRTQSGEE